MKVKQITDLGVSMASILKSLGPKGGIVEVPGKKEYVLMPLDDGLLDYLLERSPKLIKESREIRRRMTAGHFVSHEQVKKRLGA